jgi:hypothetical protein
MSGLNAEQEDFILEQGIEEYYERRSECQTQ